MCIMNSHKLLFSILLGSLFFSSFSFAFFPTCIVNGTSPVCVTGDSYYDTIQEAIDAADSSTCTTAIIVCKNGTGKYTENVVINKSVSLYGNESKILIGGGLSSNTGVLVNASNPSFPVFNITVQGVNISNFTLMDSNSAGLWTNSSNLSIDYVASSDNLHGFAIHASDNTPSTTVKNVNLNFNYVFNNSVRGFWFNNSQYNVLYRNSAFNNTYYGFYLRNNVHNNNLTANEAYDNHNGYGFYINTASNNNTLTNNSAENNLIGFVIQATTGNTFYGNNASLNTYSGFSFAYSANNNTLTFNNAFNNSDHGFYFNATVYNNLTNNTAFNNSDNGFYLSNGTGYNILNNSAFNNSANGFYLFQSSQNVLANNTIYNNSNQNSGSMGIKMIYSNSNNISNNVISDNYMFGVYLFNASSNLIISNNITGSYYGGVSLSTNSISNSIQSNDVSSIGFSYGTCYSILSNSNSNDFLSNNASYCNSGFFVNLSSDITFSNNTVLNATVGNYGSGYNLLNSSINLTSGYHYILNASKSTNTSDFYLNNSFIYSDPGSNTIVSDYAIYFPTFFSNVTIKTFNLSDIGINISTDTLTGINSAYALLTGYNVPNHASPNIYGALEIFNTSATASTQLTMPFNLSSANTSNFDIVSYNSSGSESYEALSSELTNQNELSFTASSFSYFFPMYLVISSSSSSGGEDTSLKDLSVIYEFTCSDGNLEVTANDGSSTVEGVNVLLMRTSPGFSSETESTGSNGLALFQIGISGSYKISGSKSGYSSTSKNTELILCLITEQETEPEPEPEPETEPEPEPESIVEEPTTSIEEITAQETISNAQENITKAKEEGKLTKEAETKLQEAQEALDQGNYELAEELATEALTLISEPLAEPEVSEEIPEPELLEPSMTTKEEAEDYTWIPYVIGIIVIIVIISKMFSGKKKKYKGYKGT